MALTENMRIAPVPLAVWLVIGSFADGHMCVPASLLLSRW
jgi:hypothetical protein